MSNPLTESGAGVPPRRRRTAAVILGAVMLAGGAYWRFGTGQPLPAVDTTDREPDIAAAIAAAQSEVRGRPRSGAAWGKLGLVLLAHDYEPQARECLAHAELLDPHEPRWAYLNARLVHQQDPQAAVLLLRRAADLAGANSVPRLHLAETLFCLGQTDDAAVEFQRVLAVQPDNPRALVGLARIAYRNGELDAALAGARRAAAAVPRLRAVHALLAQIHQRRGETTAAAAERALLATCEEMSWPDPYMAEIAEHQAGSPGRVARAERLLREGRRQEALKLLQSAVQAAPDAFRARVLLGRQLAAQGQLPEAEVELREALRLRPGLFEALGDLGMVLQREEKYREAAEVYQQVLAVQSAHALAHFNLAHCQEKLGDRPAALASLRAAVKYNPELIWAHQVLGRLLIDARQQAEAIKQLQIAHHLDPTSAETNALLQKARRRAP